jgi:hypothetical protein
MLFGETLGNGSTELEVDLLDGNLASGKLATDGEERGDGELAILGKGDGVLGLLSIGSELLLGDWDKIVVVEVTVCSSD